MRHHTTLRLFELIKELEKKTGEPVQQKDIADATGLDRRTVAAFVKGKTRRIDLDHVDRLLDFFHAQGMPVTVSDLFVVERSE